MSTIVASRNIVKKFGAKIALNAISFDIKEGEIFGFLGPSGSGKTTMINILTGQLLQDAGNTQLLGKNSHTLTPTDLEKVGIVSDKSGFYEKLSLEKNLLLYAKLYGVGLERVRDLLGKVGLLESKDVLAEELSTGMKQRMLLARALINQPKILFLDEPTSGLDPTTSKSIHELLLSLKESGTTIFLTTHDMNEATLLCDNLALLNQGKLIEQGKPADIIQKYNINKRLRVTYADHQEKVFPFSDLTKLNTKDVVAIHSCEPTLEEIFINLTGEKLNV
ncbi:ABC transporter ATP-binding protein [Streptococcus anginosus]|jgi:ABC-2 type transport system ATP-binding protein|uniref:ABC transporter ATP-binding protein n=2 Tax=Streptococcus anginosus TaxID=1328 RepID=A0A2T0FY89_STRAP|nr:MULTISPECIES: ABC transporter ATP-binding protein [Streptococcus]MCW0988721.1 ABC transporter ATP-binding protein [Streptococcus anginosus]NGG16909.1 ABC transporter ATP-binding protein [Streptococcus anginosus]NGG24288.1 ABC transporter ATP-binding protein [Streptococcus anginosus]PRT68800.1 ABC transporter ATP-binding protein [Streptococcus anginosus]WEB05500.1 ABC transporter ATP-binding protein [Streptococcus anginosus]